MEDYLIKLVNVSKVYNIEFNKTVSILNNINFSFPKKGLFIIYGRSGSGKSTLLNLISGISKPSQGEIFFKNQNIKDFNENSKVDFFKNDIGIIFQNFNLVNDLTVYDNLKITSIIKQVSENTIDEYLKKYNLFELKNRKVYLLSGGEKQRIALIRCLINNPPVVLADEPTGNLDYSNSKYIINELYNISKDRLVIVVTHKKDIIKNYNENIIQVKNGKIFYNNKQKNNTFDTNQNIYKNINDKKDNIKLNIKFIKFLTFKNIRKNLKNNIFSIISLFISLVSILLIFSFKLGFNNNSSKLINSYQNSGTFYISKIERKQVKKSNINIEKNTSLNDEEIKYFKNKYDVDIYKSPRFFLKNKIKLTIDDIELKGISLEIVDNLKDNNEVYVNESFFNYYKKILPGNCLNKIINFYSCNDYTYSKIENNYKYNYSEKLELKTTFKIIKKRYEFKYLNKPKIYFSYNYFINLLKNNYLIKYYNTTNKIISYYDLLIKSNYDDEINNYENIIFIHEKNKIKNFYDVNKNNEKYKITNDSLYIIDSFVQLSNVIYKASYIFLIISTICSLSIIMVQCLANFIKNRKKSSILTILGAKDDEITLIYILENLLITLISLIISIIFSNSIIKLLNNIIYKKVYFDRLLEMPSNLLTYLLLTYILLGVIYIITYLLLYCSKKNELAKELKAE